METDNLLIGVAVVAVALSLVGVFITYSSVSRFNDFITGFAVETGVVNVTIQSQAIVEIISAGGVAGSKNITWGVGSVNTTGLHTYAVLATNGTVYGGLNWSTISEGFVVQNVGNVNVNLSIHADRNATTLIGGDSPLFQYNMSNHEANSCNDFVIDEGVYLNFTTSEVAACNNFTYTTTSNELMLDILLRIPYDSLIGERVSTITLTYEEI